MNYKVSVVIPCYNVEEFIEKCIYTIPDRKDMEIICINDGSTDNTLNILNKLKKDKNIKVIDIPTNKGVSNARNMGIEEAKGEYILFMDGDDYVFPVKFDYICDNCLDKADIIYFDMQTNDGYIITVRDNTANSRCGTFKFIRKKLIGDTRFPLGVQYGEDRQFHNEIVKKIHSKYCTGIVMIHYNYPRVGSLTYLEMNKDN